MPKPFTVKVLTVEAELDFAIQPSTTVKQLFDQVARTIGLREIWYFGLQYMDSKNLLAWARMHKKVSQEDFPKDSPVVFHFLARYFPESAEDELIFDVTRRLFFLQIKDSIIREEVYCSPETAVLLASLAVQAKYGDHIPELHRPGFLAAEVLIPSRIIEQHKLTRAQWEANIIAFHKDRVGLAREDAMVEYIKTAEELDMYGITYFEICNKKGTRLWLGVDAQGLNVYDFKDKLTPRAGFPWNEIRNVHFSGQTFTISPMDRKGKDFVFHSERLRINKRILALCMGNHELFIRRRNPESIEIQQMRLQAREERSQRQAERAYLTRERSARQEADRRRVELEDRVKKFEDEARVAMIALARSEKQAKELEAKVKQAQAQAAEREALWLAADRARTEAEAAARRMRESRSVSDEEKAALIKATRMAEARAAAMQEEAEKRDREARELNEALLAAKRQQVEDARALMAASQSPPPAPDETDVDGDADVDEEAYKAMTGNEDLLANVRSQAMKERVTMAEKNKVIKEQLQALASILGKELDATKLSDMDRLHRGNVEGGRDKFKTLRNIRSGNTKQRVADFENM
eukprot:m.24009 g.24009  ORF g.24009 m.24009 type:complete len:581 (+) comp8601_c0_seq1:2526-4268(+)